MEKRHEPQIGAWFKVNRWNENSLEQLKTELDKAVADDPHITDATKVELRLESAGNKVDRIRLVGTASSREEAERAVRIVETNTHDEVAVENELAVR
jgi:hypothetical protein